MPLAAGDVLQGRYIFTSLIFSVNAASTPRILLFTSLSVKRINLTPSFSSSFCLYSSLSRISSWCELPSISMASLSLVTIEVHYVITYRHLPVKLHTKLRVLMAARVTFRKDAVFAQFLPILLRLSYIVYFVFHLLALF